MPRIRSIFAILLPKIFPIAISVLPFILAKIFTKSSGIEVPKATIVKPMTMFEIFNLLAIEAEPSTNRLAPLTKTKKPTINKNPLPFGIPL